MSKKDQDQEPVDPGQPSPGVEEATLIDLDEYCRTLSQTERRPSLIGGFHFKMTRAGKLRATASDYDADYAQFLVTPC